MTTMKEIMKNWDILRVIRLVSGAGFAIYGIYINDSMLIMLGSLLALMAIINLSCCAGGCGTGNSKKGKYQDFIETYKPENTNNN